MEEKPLLAARQPKRRLGTRRTGEDANEDASSCVPKCSSSPAGAPPAPPAGMDWAFVRRLWRLLTIASASGGTGTGAGGTGNATPSRTCSSFCGSYTFTVLLVLVLVGLLVAQTWVVSLTGAVIGGFYQSITDRAEGAFLAVVRSSILVVSCSAVMLALVDFVQALLAWRWRRALCSHLHGRYFVNALFYKVVSFTGDCDNPDQRITQDVDKWSQALGIVFSGVLSAPLVIGYYLYLTTALVGWFAPAFITAYFLIGYIGSKMIMGPVSRLVFLQEQLEGDFRFAHVRVRTCAESIALYAGQDCEREYTVWRLGLALRNQLKLACWKLFLAIASNLFSYGGSVVNYAVVGFAVFYFSDIASHQAANPTPEFVGKATFACIMLAQGFSQFLNVTSQLSDLAGYTARVALLWEVLDELDLEDDADNHGGDDDSDDGDIDSNSINNKTTTLRDTNSIEDDTLRLGPKIAFLADSWSYQNEPPPNDTASAKVKDGDCISFQNVTCYTPDSTCLVRDLSFRVDRGNNLLITGPSGCGKSSILRVLNGLWPFASGVITKPGGASSDVGPLALSQEGSADNLLYLPQDPYLFFGTIMDQITYPRTEAQISRETAVDLLRVVGLSYLAQDPGLNEVVFWPDRLSPGEQQLVQFARLFFRAPAFAVLDEATSSLDERSERLMYSECARRNITLVSVGHRSTLRRYHTRLLTLAKPKTDDDDNMTSDARCCSWSLVDIPKAAES